MTAESDSWDAVVVGAGPAGCVMAARLVDSGRRVMLIEAGPGEPRPAAVAGLDVIAAAEDPSRQWPDSPVRARPDGPVRHYRQGFGLGGGSMINALLLSPGDHSDYQRWEQQYGCRGWGPDHMRPWLAKARAAIPGGSVAPGPMSEAFGRAAVGAGHDGGGTSLDPGRLGVLDARLAIEGGRRRSAVDAYLPGSMSGGSGSSNLPALLTGRLVTRIAAEGGRATGVELDDGRLLRSPLVVVTAGAIRTPGLLSRSGLVEGRSRFELKDHPSFSFTVSLRPESVEGASPGSGETLRNVSQMLRWSSGPDEYGDLQAFVIDRVDDGRSASGSGPMAVVVVGLMRVSSTGSIAGATAESAERAGDPTTGALTSQDDRRRFRSGVSEVYRLLRDPEVSPLVDEIYVDEIGTPAAAFDVMADDELDRWLIDHPGPYAHPAASCPMGPDGSARAVVSSEPERAGVLRGHEGIYLADASIMPDLVQGGLQIPVTALADRVAAAIIGEVGAESPAGNSS